MLARDNFGYVHEIPEPPQYGAPSIVYDGLGNPVGQLGDFWDTLKSIAAPITAPIQAIGQAAGSLIPAVGSLLNPMQMATGLLGNLLPHPAAPAAMPAPPMMVPAPAMGVPPPGFPGLRPPFMFPQGMQHPHHPPPLGWIHPNLPYTGLGPQRLYMRCAVWPGPAGMVPGPQMPTGPWPGPGGPGGGAPGAGGGFRRHHGHRRHR
jgi:hypothetical protein